MRSVHPASWDDVSCVKSCHRDASGWQSLWLTQGRLMKPVSPPPSQEHESYLVSSYLTHCLWGVSAVTGPALSPVLSCPDPAQNCKTPTPSVAQPEHMLQWHRRCGLLSLHCHYTVITCCHMYHGLWRHLRLQWQELCHFDRNISLLLSLFSSFL